LRVQGAISERDCDATYARLRQVRASTAAAPDATSTMVPGSGTAGGGGGGGGGGGQAPPQPQNAPPSQAPSGSLSQQEADELLNSAEREEREVQAKQQRENRPTRPPGGKDW